MDTSLEIGFEALKAQVLLWPALQGEGSVGGGECLRWTERWLGMACPQQSHG